jgi:hypothetical protein
MQALLRHAGKSQPALGQPGIFSLGAAGVLEQLLTESGFVQLEQRTLALSLRMPSAREALTMMQEAFGAYRAVVDDCPEAVRVAAWAEVAEMLKSFETTSTGFIAPGKCWSPRESNPAKRARLHRGVALKGVVAPVGIDWAGHG